MARPAERLSARRLRHAAAICAIAVLAGPAAAQLEEKPVPMDKAPFHIPVFQNDYLILLNVNIPPGRNTGYHIHYADSVSVNLSPVNADGVVAYRARRTSGLVDLSRIGAYRKEEFWESLTQYSEKQELVLVPDEFYILASLEDIRVEAHEAAEMI